MYISLLFTSKLHVHIFYDFSQFIHYPWNFNNGQIAIGINYVATPIFFDFLSI